MADIIQLVVYGIVTGSILALGAIGVSLIFAILGFAHFAHGDFMTLGAYVAFGFVAGWGWPVLAAAVPALLAASGVAMLVERGVYRHLRRSSPVVLLIASFGIALILRSAIQIVWGSEPQVYSNAIEMAHRVAGIAINPDHIVIVAGSLVLIAIVHVFLQYTKFGKALRAMADNPELARISGIPARQVVMLTWCVAAGLAAVAGVFVAMDTQLIPILGWKLLLPVFAAAILGGIGRPYGAIAGGFVIGIAMEVSTIWIEPAYKQAVAFFIMVVMLVVRPKGLFAGRG